jgi:hypothetical protein
LPRQLVKVELIHKWQKDLAQILQGVPDERTVHWYWDYKGGSGKTTFAKWAFDNLNTTVVGGKCTDMLNGIKNYMDERDGGPDVVIVDLPRSQTEYLSWGGIEKIKDGLAFSGKYEGMVLRFPSPHLVVFANCPPDGTKLSEDRWHIVNIANEIEKQRELKELRTKFRCQTPPPTPTDPETPVIRLTDSDSDSVPATPQSPCAKQLDEELFSLLEDEAIDSEL